MTLRMEYSNAYATKRKFITLESILTTLGIGSGNNNAGRNWQLSTDDLLNRINKVRFSNCQSYRDAIADEAKENLL